MLYGTSKNIETTQTQYKKSNQKLFRTPSVLMHELPAVLSEGAKKTKEVKKPTVQSIDDKTKFYCTNYCCGAIFTRNENNKRECRYHSGVWQFGSHNGYWPAAWTCCETAWETPGCTTGKHTGVILEKRKFLCINVGEKPEHRKPDSGCGKYFTKDTTEDCKIHSGKNFNLKF